MFVELLGRSCFSFLRGASQPEELMAEALRLRLPGVALCDLDGLYGTVRAWSFLRRIQSDARALGKEPPALHYIVGAELSLELAEQERFRVALLVETSRGYEHLCRLLTLAKEGRPKGESSTTLENLVKHQHGLSALIIAPRKHTPQALRPAGQLKEAFGERLAVVTYRHLDGYDVARQRWVQELARELEIPIAASARPGYHNRNRKPLSDVLHCIRRGITLDQAGTALSANSERFLKSEPKMRELYGAHPEWLEETGRIATRCRFDFRELKYHFPCRLEEGQSADERLAELTWEGVGRRFPGGISEKLRAQIKKELALIKKIEVAPYFLSTLEIVEMARRRKILCQGRGSAANSAVCFVLGITAIDPSRSNLLFERFLSEERAEPPDIDIDFEHERREEVIQEIYDTYGREQAAMVSEVISYRGKSALREVGKVFGLTLEQVDRLSRTVSWTSLKEASERRLEDAGFNLDDPRLGQVLLLAGQLQGFPRHLSIHVGGFVLSAKPLYEVAPVEPARMEGRTIIPWDKDDIEALGFFKVDVLSLGMLTAIRKALELIHQGGGLGAKRLFRQGTASIAQEERAVSGQAGASRTSPGEDFDPLEVITRIPPEDQPTYDMICQADTIGVFQIESRAQMAMLPRLRPRKFYDLVVEVALVRPGPIQGGMVHPYLRRRNGEEEVSCPHPDLWPILERTMGVPLFQEQVMQIAITGAGYTGGEADQLRRDMAAWKKHGRLLRHRERLLRGFAERGISPEFGAALFEQIKGFGEYGFPESHASSFALLVYASSWQKRHYPAHFCAAIINSQPMGFYQPTTLVKDAQKHGVEVRDVCVLQSSWDCTLEDVDPEKDRIDSMAPGAHRALRLGLRIVRGLGQASAERIVQLCLGRQPETVEQLRSRARLHQDELDALAEAGALTSLVSGRRDALWQARAPRTTGLFEGTDSGEPAPELPALRSVEQLVLDYQRKGLSLHDHPLRYFRRKLSSQGVVRAADLLYLPKGAPVRVAGLVMTRQRPGTASGVVFITLEDETGSANLVLFTSVFDRFDRVARTAQILIASGELERSVAPAKPELPAPTPVLHVVVRHLEELSGSRGKLASRSRDFH